MKLIGNTLISFMLEGLCEGLVVGQRAGVSIEKILEVVMASGFSSPYYPFKGSQIAKRDFDQHFSIDLLVKDQTLMLKEAESLGVPMPGLAAIREVCQAARAQGHGQEDIAAVVKAIETAAGGQRGDLLWSARGGPVPAGLRATLRAWRPGWSRSSWGFSWRPRPGGGALRLSQFHSELRRLPRRKTGCASTCSAGARLRSSVSPRPPRPCRGRSATPSAPSPR